FVGARFRERFVLRLRARRREDFGAERLGDLDGGHPDATAGARDEDAIAEGDATERAQRAQRDAERARDRRRLDIGNLSGDLHERSCGGHDELGVASVARLAEALPRALADRRLAPLARAADAASESKQIRHPVARRPFGDTWRYFQHLSGKLVPE